MTRICGILTIAVGLAVSGCASDNLVWQDHNSPQSDKVSASARTDGMTYEQRQQDYSSNPSGTVVNSNSVSTDNSSARVTGSMSDTSTSSGVAYSATTDTTRPSADVADANNGAGPQLGLGSDKIPSAGISNQDNRFINEAIAGGMYEVNAAERALMKSQDSNVKGVAQHILDDHEKANRQLKALANRESVRVITGMTNDQDNKLAQLDKLSGSDFDREYLRQQEAAHQETIQKFQDIASNANDKDLREWAAATLPTLREHLQMVENQTPAVNTNTGIGIEK